MSTDTKASSTSPYTSHLLSNYEVNRYSRQIIIAEFGVKGKGWALIERWNVRAGQEKLLRSSALIVGAGGLGCPVAIYLGRSGRAS